MSSSNTVRRKLSSVRSNEAILSRKKCLEGSFSAHVNDSNQWKCPSWMLTIFLSSVASDSNHERDFILTDILRILRDTGRSCEIEVNFVDTKSPLQGNDVYNYVALRTSQCELSRCRDVSMGIFFLSLQSHKYGPRPLPYSISRTMMDDKLTSLDAEDKELVLKLYFLDMNEESTGSEKGHYVLEAVTEENKELFTNVLRVLDGLTFDDTLAIGESFPSLELKTAVSEFEDKNRLIWLNRIFKGDVPNSAEHADNNDSMESPSAHIPEKHKSLIEFMESVFQNPQLKKTFDIASFKDFTSSSKVWIKQFEQFKGETAVLLTESLTPAIDIRKAWTIDGCGLGIPGKELTEILRHYEVAANFCSEFCGMDDLLLEAYNCLQSTNTAVPAPTNGFDIIALALIGDSGSGKSAFISKLADKVKQSTSLPVIIRFCELRGDTGGSCSGRMTGLQLMQSICHQLHFLMELPFNTENILSMDFRSITPYFHKLMSECPVILFIDGLDQISDESLARSYLTFLKDCNPKPHIETKVIISSLPDDDSTTCTSSKDGFEGHYGCDQRMKEANIPRIHIQIPNTERRFIIQSLLSRNHRSITSKQWSSTVDKSIQTETAGIGTALYLHLTYKVIRQWTSYTTDIEHLTIPENIYDLTNHIIDRLEHAYGRNVIKSVFSFITFSVQGISDAEMVDLLSLDNNMISTQGTIHSYDGNGKFPIHIWYALRGELCRLLISQETNGFCLKFCHRRVLKVCQIRFQSERIYYHGIMGRYFGNIVHAKVTSARGVESQPLVFQASSIWFDGSTVNKRRCLEAAHHLIEADLLLEAKDELCNVDAICARAKIRRCTISIVQLSVLYSKLITQSSTARYSPEVISEVYHYMRWLREGGKKMMISTNPALTACETAFEQPQHSIVKHHIYYKMMSLTKSNMFTPHDFIYCKTLNGRRYLDNATMTLAGHNYVVSAVAISQDDKIFVSASSDRSIKIWDAATGHLKDSLHGTHEDWLTSVAISSKTNIIVSGANDSLVKVWDASSGIVKHTLREHSDRVIAVAISSDGCKILSCSWDKTVRVWHVHTGVLYCTLLGHSDHVLSVKISFDGSFIASASKDKTVRLWDHVNSIESYESTHTLIGHSDVVTSVAISRDGSLVISGSNDKSIKIWFSATGVLKGTLDGHVFIVTSVDISGDGSTIVSSSYDKTVKIWEVASGQLKNSLEGHTAQVTSVAISYNGSIVTSGSSDNSVIVWDTVHVNSVNTVEGHSKSVTAIAVSDDFSFIVSASTDKLIKTWDSITGNLRNTLKGHKSFVTCIAISPDGCTIISGSKDNTMKVWNIGGNNNNSNSTSNLKATLSEHSGLISSVAISRDGLFAVSGSWDKTLKLWSCMNGAWVFLRTLEGHTNHVTSVAISSDSRVIVSGSLDSTVRVWNGEEGIVKHILESHSDGVLSVAISSDSSFIVSGSLDKSIKIWDYLSGGLKNTLEGHSNKVTSVAVSPSIGTGTARIVSGSEDKTVKVWDALTGELVNNLQQIHTAGITAIAMSSDGSVILSASSDKTIKMYSAISN